jgi:hypothetical protein
LPDRLDPLEELGLPDLPDLLEPLEVLHHEDSQFMILLLLKM